MAHVRRAGVPGSFPSVPQGRPAPRASIILADEWAQQPLPEEEEREVEETADAVRDKGIPPDQEMDSWGGRGDPGSGDP
jgi:hypothetical protein